MSATINCKVWNIHWFQMKFYWEIIVLREVRQKKLVPSILNMFVRMSGSYNPLAHTHYNTICGRVDEC